MRQWTYATAFNLTVAAGVAIWYKFNVVDKRKDTYDAFWKTWDDDKEYARMKRAGIFKGYESE